MTNTTDPRGVDTGELRQVAVHAWNNSFRAPLGERLVDMAIAAADELDQLHARVAEQDDHLAFVERYANHHANKHPSGHSITAREALSVIQHYPPIEAITKRYVYGRLPDTPNVFEQIVALEQRIAELEPNDRRYRRIRDVPWFGTGSPLERVIAQQRNAHWDEAIDSAMGISDTCSCTTREP